MNGTVSVAVTFALPKIINVNIDNDTITVDLEDGRTVLAPIGWFPRLAYGTSTERRNFHISGAGYGIHWPDLDEDISVEGLLLGKKTTESAASLESWLKNRRQ